MTAKNLSVTALSSVIIAVCSWIYIPFTVPFTLQTFAVFGITVISGGKKSLIATAVYIAMGALGIPVFAGFTGGIGHILSPTGGYIIGMPFIPICFMIYEAVSRKQKTPVFVPLTLGLIICYAIGSVWFYFVFAKKGEYKGILSILNLCVFPYILPDAAKMAVAITVGKKTARLLKKRG